MSTASQIVARGCNGGGRLCSDGAGQLKLIQCAQSTKRMAGSMMHSTIARPRTLSDVDTLATSR
jgi:hypothetical protein